MYFDRMNKRYDVVNESELVYEETALDWLQRLNSHFVYLHTGHADFDKLKMIRSGDLIEIVGGDATGKMQLGMTIIAELLLSGDKRDHIVYVVDFNGSFRMERLVEIFTQRMCQAGENTSNYIGEALLNRIRCSKAISSYELEIRLLELESLLSSASQTVPIIFINKIGSILSNAALNSENLEGNMQKRVLATLKEFCQKFGATIITTNHLVEWRGYPSPALGKPWINGISRRIILRKDYNGYSASIIVDGQVSDSKISYLLTERGFCDCNNIINFDKY